MPSHKPSRKRTSQYSVAPPVTKRAKQSKSTGALARDCTAGSGQKYGIATHDALFKYVLSDDGIRPSFFETFIPRLKIKKSTRLDEHMNPIQELQHLRDLIHCRETLETVGSMASADYFVSICGAGPKRSRHSKNDKATKFLHDIVANFEDMRNAFPKAQYNGTMDFVCELDDGKYALVEMQVLPQDNWDKRALAYVAAFYGNQLRKGLQWRDLKEVVGINILGGGTREQGFWKDTDDQYMRHYKFQEHCHKQSCERFIDGIQLFQYSLMNAPTAFDSAERAKQDWITFFKRGSRMTEKEVKSEILTKAVLKAFKRATLSKLPKSVKKNYDAENSLYAQCSEHTAELVAEGEARGRADAILQVARRLIQSTTLTDAAIAKSLELEESQVAKMRL